MRIFKDERGHIFNNDELVLSYLTLKREGDTEAETYLDYLKNCTSKDGTLTEITKRKDYRNEIYSQYG